jgi:hypothetical protein
MFTVLIDTSSYEKYGLSFTTPVFKSLEKLSDEGKILIATCSIVNNEIEAHLKMSIAQSVNMIAERSNKFDHITKNNLGIITRLLSDLPQLKHDILNNRIEDMQSFFSKVTCEELDISKVNINNIFTEYFNVSPPFKEGKEKEQFPDAFMLHAFIEKYKNNLSQACLVSADGGWEKFAAKYPDIRIFKTIADFSDFINTNYNEILVSQVKGAIGHKFDDIQNSIIGIIKDRDIFDFDDHWVDPEASLNEKSIEVKIIDVNILDCSSEQADCEIEVTIAYELEVYATDGDSWIRDYETKDIIYTRSSFYTARVTKTMNIDVEVFFDSQSISSSTEVGKITLPDELFYIDCEDDDIKITDNNEIDYEE